MSDFKVASRYAKSLIELANSNKELEEVHNDVILIAEGLEGSREFCLLLASPIVKHKKKKTIIKAIYDGKVNTLTMRFLELLCDKSRESLLEAILKEFIKQYNIIRGIQLATITTTIPLSTSIPSAMINAAIDIFCKSV